MKKELILMLTAMAFSVTIIGVAKAESLPKRIGQCVKTKVKDVTTRLEGVADSGSAITFTNGGYQVSYEQVLAVNKSKPGDPVVMCLVSIPKNCPPGDKRGRVYHVTNKRTKKSWLLPDAEHMCGGA